MKCPPLDSPLPQTTPELLCKYGFKFPATQHRANPPTDQIMSSSPCHLAPSIMMSNEVLSKPPPFSRKASSVHFPVSHCFLHMCNHMLQCGFSGLPWFLGKLVLL